MGRFDGKVVLITGGARGQGRSHALAFAKEGAEIVVTDIAKQVETVPYGMSSESDLAETVAQVEALDRRCLSFVADARDSAATNAAVEGAISEFGQIDILLANHGLLSLSPVADMSDAMWDDVISSDLTGVFKSIRSMPSVPAVTDGVLMSLTAPHRPDSSRSRMSRELPAGSDATSRRDRSGSSLEAMSAPSPSRTITPA
jgi:NAD(P)-dependent dehydrogenase (short-subunit alcohol dehydrogenase family)